MMYKFIILALTCLNVLASVCAQRAPDSRPNIIFILSDDHAYQAVSAYGHGLNHTPNIDLLAKQGMLFNRAFVNNSLCAPSRAAFLTGKYSHLNGIRGNGNEVFNGSQPTFPALLKKGGYQTALFGKWHLGSDPVGFDEWNILPGQGDYYNPDFINANGKSRQQGYVTDLTTDFALEWLDHRDTASPFCLLVWNKAPHRNWMPALKYLHLFDSTDIPVPPNLFDDYATRTKAAHKQEMEISKWLSPNYDLKESFEPGSLTHRYDDLWKNVLDRLSADQKNALEAAYTPANEALLKTRLSGRELTLWKYQRYVKGLPALRTVR
jgi:arylsulfatase A-like enzyme